MSLRPERRGDWTVRGLLSGACVAGATALAVADLPPSLREQALSELRQLDPPGRTRPQEPARPAPPAAKPATQPEKPAVPSAQQPFKAPAASPAAPPSPPKQPARQEASAAPNRQAAKPAPTPPALPTISPRATTPPGASARPPASVASSPTGGAMRSKPAAPDASEQDDPPKPAGFAGKIISRLRGLVRREDPTAETPLPPSALRPPTPPVLRFEKPAVVAKPAAPAAPAVATAESKPTSPQPVIQPRSVPIASIPPADEPTDEEESAFADVEGSFAVAPAAEAPAADAAPTEDPFAEIADESVPAVDDLVWTDPAFLDGEAGDELTEPASIAAEQAETPAADTEPEPPAPLATTSEPAVADTDDAPRPLFAAPDEPDFLPEPAAEEVRPATELPVAEAETAPAADPQQRLRERSDKAGLLGFCVVTLRQRQALIDGCDDFVTTYHGRTYRFATRDAKAAFDAAPEQFAPAVGGRDVVLAAGGLEIEGSLRHATYYANRLYLFRSEQTYALFTRDPARYVCE